jgi:lauroyl/myristoyl acyltransferase
LLTIRRFLSESITTCLSFGFTLIRVAERTLPQRLLDWLLWPAAALIGVVEAKNARRALTSWNRLRDIMPVPPKLKILFWQTLAGPHARLVYLFPDRLSEPRWQRRVCLTTEVDLAQLRAETRPIVFVTVHCGLFETLVYWLRAYGFPTTVLVGRAAPRQRLKQRQYRLSPPSNLPLALPVPELKRLRDPGYVLRHLLIMMDVDRGQQIEIEMDGALYRCATGPVRFAKMWNALLVPCFAAALPRWRFHIHLGRPVSYSASANDTEQVVRELLEQLLPFVRQKPEQCGHRFLSAVRPASPICKTIMAATRAEP